MAYQIFWSPTAKKSYLSILEYLMEEWTKREAKNFAKRVDKSINQLAQNPYLNQYSKESDTFQCVLVKQVSLFYRLKGKHIELLVFWDTRRNPRDLKL